MSSRDFRVFLVRYADKPNRKFMNLAVCMSEVSDGDSRFLACECTDKWGELAGLFPSADIDFLREWCAAVQKEFCAPHTNRSVEERLEDCSSQIDVSVSYRALEATDEPNEKMRKLVREHLR
jgi:hypothetical protein